jgi:type II secretory pathway component PulJ
MKSGFMLIELIIATLIASMVAGVLLAALFQSTRVQTSVDNVIDLSVRVGVVANQLEKDLIGCFVPKQASLITSSSAEASKDGKKEQTEEFSPESDKKNKPKPIEKIFYSTNKNGQLDALTFITNNPLAVYVGKDVGVVKPKVVRVQYSLKPENEKKDSFALFRQESIELDLENYKNITPYEVIGGIKKCTITFTAKIKKQPAEAPAAADSANAPKKAENPKISYEYKTLNEWVSEQKKEDNKEKSEFPRIPYQVEMKLVLWDKQEKKDKEFTIVCEIPTDFSPIKNKKESEKPKKDESREQQSAEDKDKQQPTQVAQNKSTTKEIITIPDANGKVVKIVLEAENNEATMKEIQKMFGRA